MRTLITTAVFLLAILSCAATDKFFGGSPSDPQTAPMHDLVQGSDDPNNAQPMFMRRPDAGRDAAADAVGDR